MRLPRALMGAVLLGFALIASTDCRADPAQQARATYEAFAAAQNRHDLEAVQDLLLDSPTFLWVSDGKSIWGRAATLQRMGLFQQARIWQVEPELAKAVPVVLNERAAFLHLPLELSLAFSQAEPERLRFLVSVLCVETAQGWRIAA